MGNPAMLARMMAESDGPMPAYPVLEGGSFVADRFAAAYRYAAALNT